MNGRRRSVRRPVRRRPPRRYGRRPRRGKSHGLEQVVLAALAATVVLGLAAAALRWLVAHPRTVAAVLVVAVAGAGAWAWRRREAARWEQVRASGLRYALRQLDVLHHRAFEFTVRDLMRRDGCTDARQVGGHGDNGADVKATDPYGRRWVIQCKHRKDGWAGKPVGTPDLHVLNGTGRQVHGGDILVMLTNGRITATAVDFAQSQRLHLVDRHLLAEWAGGSRPLWDLLRALPPRGRQEGL
ncbi:restriction endonuclease [Streptomyces sp. A1136]|uniref:restriction endonuclease n=1 Tax=Streptomyces sp. A1136 TaxID=2563102 RepID=UPI00109E9E7D|nr:restriction endonuclease [Streptomyces sp. A1136]THA48360.1 restriction endonuclease [Streptomyces sp. A1136]